MCLAKIGILLHCLLNVYENVMILTGRIPFLTKGPFAMFFGGDAILAELNDETSGKHLPILYLVSTLFSFAIAMIKKHHSRKISRGQQLKELVVGNFLNLLTLSAIILFVTVLTIGLSNHFRTIDANSGVSSNAARTNAIKSLVIQTCMETFVQLYSFATNSALRLFTWKKLKGVWAEVLGCVMVARLGVAMARGPRSEDTQNMVTRWSQHLEVQESAGTMTRG